MSDLHGVTIDTIFFKKRNFWIYAELQLTSMFEQAHKIYVVKTLDLQKVTLWCPVFFHKYGINSWFITKRCFEITDIGIDHSICTSPSLCPSKWSCVPILTPPKKPSKYSREVRKGELSGRTVWLLPQNEIGAFWKCQAHENGMKLSGQDGKVQLSPIILNVNLL